MKKPKIRYKIKKLRLNKILKHYNINSYFIEEYISNAHNVADHISHFIRAFILYCYKNKLVIPLIDDNFFKLCSVVLTTKPAGGNLPKGENKAKIELLKKFYDDFYSKLGYCQEDKISSLHLSQMISYIATEYTTAIDNNIKNNFIEYLKRFVNASFITKLKNKISEETNDEFQEYKNIENDYFNLILPIIEQLINQITSLLKNKFYPLKNYKFKSNADKKELIFLEKTKQKYVVKYKNICKKLKVKPKPEKNFSNLEISINDIRENLKFIREINEGFVDSVKDLKIKSNFKRKKRDEEMKKLRDELFKVKNDIIENVNNSDPKYSDFIKNIRDNILPIYDKNKFTLIEHINEEPQKYIKSMIEIVGILEKNNYKLFQFLPLYTTLIQRSVKIDTKTLIEIFIDEDKNKYLSNVCEYQKEIWKDLFKINDSTFRLSKSSPYIFEYSIVTNGYTASIIFIHKDDKNAKTEGQNLFKEKRQINKNLLEDLNEEEKIAFKKKQEEEQKERKTKKAIENNKKQKERRAQFKKLTKEQQNKMKEENKRKNQDFLYIDELNNNELKEIKKKSFQNQIVTLDPGKKNLIYMQNASGKILRYSNKEHIKKTKRLEYAEKLKELKDNLGITKKENKLSKYSSKTVDFKNFCKYIKKRNTIKKKIQDKYQNIKFRQLKWYSYINNERVRATLINNISKKFGQDIIIFYGDWSIGKQMANFISTPNLSLKRRIAEKFKVYNLDEYNTSKLSNATFKECENLILKDKFGVPRELHSVLTYKKENKGLGCNLENSIKCQINRDNNSSRNMMYIIKYFIKNKEFPKEFTRNTKKVQQFDTIEKIHNIFKKLKDSDIKNLKIEEMETSINDKNIGQLLYLIKNAVSKKKTLIPEKIKENSDKNISEYENKILKELKKSKEKLISTYKNKEELKLMFKEQQEKKPKNPVISKINGVKLLEVQKDKLHGVRFI
jgi:hypothetical protein